MTPRKMSMWIVYGAIGAGLLYLANRQKKADDAAKASAPVTPLTSANGQALPTDPGTLILPQTKGSGSSAGFVEGEGRYMPGGPFIYRREYEPGKFYAYQ